MKRVFELKSGTEIYLKPLEELLEWDFTNPLEWNIEMYNDYEQLQNKKLTVDAVLDKDGRFTIAEDKGVRLTLREKLKHLLFYHYRGKVLTLYPIFIKGIEEYDEIEVTY